MAYTDEKFFEFPVKLYDPESLISLEIKKLRGEEEFETEDDEEEIYLPEADWAESSKVCLPEDIIAWIEGGDRGNKAKDLAEKGFPRCIVTIKENYSIGVYECVWPKKKFEQRLNAFMAKRDK